MPSHFVKLRIIMLLRCLASTKQKTKKGSWRLGDLEHAAHAVRNGRSLGRAAKDFGVPKTALHGHQKIEDEKPVRPHGGTYPVFTAQQEQDFVQYLLTLSKLFYGSTPLELRGLAFELAEEE